MQLQNLFSKFVLNKRVITIAGIVLVLAAVSWQFVPASEKGEVFSKLKGNIISLFQTKSETAMSDEELSTANTEIGSFQVSEAGWEIRKAVAGESIWSVYRAGVSSKNDLTIKNQAINGLKNLTVLKNNISETALANNSLIVDKEYSFIALDVQDRYIAKLVDANNQLKEGKKFSDLSSDLQTAYRVANAPSYSALASMHDGAMNLLR